MIKFLNRGTMPRKQVFMRCGIISIVFLMKQPYSYGKSFLFAGYADGGPPFASYALPTG